VKILESSQKENIQEKVQLSCPLFEIVTTAFALEAVLVSDKHLMPAAPAGKETVMVPPPIQADVYANAILDVSEDVVVPISMSEAAAVAHSFAKPRPSPIRAPAWAAVRALRNCGSATAERMPTMATTIMSSTKVKPLATICRVRRVRSRASWVLL
jgi:hypothetical protein